MVTWVILAVAVMLVLAVIAAAGGLRTGGVRRTAVRRPAREVVVERPAPVGEAVVERRTAQD
jgi:hypothetical protein